MNLFKNRKKSDNEDDNNKDKGDNGSSKYKEAFKTGSSIAGTMTSRWNSQENPGKVYVADRRIHHGGIGAIMKLSKYFKKSEPTVTGIVSGIGEGLTKDDYADRNEWFKFKKKHEESPSSTRASSASSKSFESQEDSNSKSQPSESDAENKTTNDTPT
jgi:hypothetical protein